jgi:hypothetical protein
MAHKQNSTQDILAPHIKADTRATTVLCVGQWVRAGFVGTLGILSQFT